MTLVVMLCGIVSVRASTSYQSVLAEAETAASTGNTDSARSLFAQALQLAESEYDQSDTTIDIVFYPDGIRTPVYFDSYAGARQTYTELLSTAEKLFGPDHAVVSDVLLKLAEVQRVLGKYYDAEPLARRVRVIREETFGAFSVPSVEAMKLLGVLYFYQGKWIESANTLDTALTMADSLLGQSHPLAAWICLDIAEAILELDYLDAACDLALRATEIVRQRFGETGLEMADCLEVHGYARYLRNKDNERAESVTYFEETIRIRQEHLRPNHPAIAKAYLRLANACRYADRLEESDTLLAAALRIRQAEFGENHPETGEIYYHLGLFYQYGISDLSRAKNSYSHGLEVRKATLDPLHPFVLKTAYRLGNVFYLIDDYSDAVTLLSRYLEQQAVVGEGESRESYSALTWLANSFDGLGQFVEGQSLWRQAESMAAGLFGDTSSQVASDINNIGFGHFRLGRFDEAESAFMRSLAIYNAVYDSGHVDIADVTGSLALAYQGQGRYGESIDMYQRALAMLEESLEGDLAQVPAVLKTNLSVVLIDVKEFAEAEKLLYEALEYYEEAVGYSGGNDAISLANLGVVYEAQGRYAEADSVLRLSIEIGEEVLGPENPGLAHALNNLANLYDRLGRYDEARPIQERAVNILEKALGAQHPEVAKFRRDLGRLYAHAGATRESLDSYDKFIDWSQRYLENVFPYSSEQQKLLWISKYPIIDPTVFSLALRDGTNQSRKLALEMLLKSKAMVIEAVMAEKQAAYCHYDDEILAEIERLNEVNSEIAGLSMAGGYYVDSVSALYMLKDSLEVALSRHCSEFSDALAARRFEVGDVVSSIPDGSVLWEFVRYQPTNLDLSITGDAKLSPDRYLAFAVERDGSINLSDLGDASEVDSLITVARDMIYKAQPQIYSVAAQIAEQRLNEVTGRLYNILFAPLVGDKTDIYVSPDGLLNLLPFEMLPMPDGSYAIENYRISYLSSGRDLLKHKGGEPSEGEILVMADPDFDGTAIKTEMSDEFYGPQMRGNTACLSRSFSPLPYSRTEASSVVTCFANSNVSNVHQYYGAQASEELLKSMSTAPRVVHLATHGFFCEETDTTSSLMNNPLLRSGLVMTGANKTISGERDDSTSREDGILTALEVSGLNLVGTDLAVLSACESGMGDFVNGEGLFGLRRAFQHAGVESIVMSLWSVPDRETSQLMNGFYRRWLDGSSKRDALRESALEVLNDSRDKRGCGHPLLWGGFILAGDPN